MTHSAENDAPCEHVCASIGYTDHQPSPFCRCARCGRSFDGTASVTPPDKSEEESS